MEIVKQLSYIPLFEGLEQRHLEHLAAIVAKRKYRRGETIFSEGAEANGFYIITSGKVKIFKTAPDGKEQILHIFGMGEPFGEVPVFTGRSYPANAEALSDASTFFFPRNAFIGLIKQDPSLALNMLSVLSMRLKRFAALIEDLSLKEVPGRLAAYLLYLSQQNRNARDLTLDISKTQLAAILGTIPETLSRILSRMTYEGIIESDERHHIRIKDRKALELLADGNKIVR
ncbi:MAG: Crp/Fnr family transcriptional regulator [Desulfobacterota bacterium]|nr:Crp/Fnr family transcriptional regulator [Thermodesulfobacteriota bacterium]